MIGTILGLIFFAIIAIACCASSGDSSSSNTTQRRSAPVRSNVRYDYDDDYCECPSCGSPYYDGYCEECGYPDVNQGWIGEEYG